MRAWVFGDNVDTDALAPGRYMKLPIGAMAPHCLEALDPSFAGAVRPGDVLVAGRNFGTGSSREQAVEVLQHLGITALVAESFAGLFYRNALNLGMPAVVCAQATRIRPGDRLQARVFDGAIENLTTGERLACEPIPAHLAPMVRDGGLLAHLEKRLLKGALDGSRTQG
jgi:3-isopropylmalate/(R)-2-methylmalate dehydratase small subunit